MRPKQMENSRSVYMAKKRKRKRKRRHSPFRTVTRLLCILAVVFCAYKITTKITQIALSKNILVSQLSETIAPEKRSNKEPQKEETNAEAIPVNTVAPGINHKAITTDEELGTKHIAPNLRINSANAVLLELESGAVVFEKNELAKMYPASMTKIMTAIVALEHIKDLDEKIELNEAIFQSIYNANAQVAGFLPNERVCAIDLLYGLLLPSGAECAVGLAEYVAGSENAFVSLMNNKAQEIGMDGSNFTNSTGLHDSNHYSTAMDMALLFRYALANDTFYEIITSSRHTTQATNKHDGGIAFYSTLFSKTGSSDFEGGSILGGKTGYTSDAGQCLASFAVKDNDKYILVTSGAAGNNQAQELHIDDAFTVYAAIGMEEDIQNESAEAFVPAADTGHTNTIGQPPLRDNNLRPNDSLPAQDGRRSRANISD